MKHHVNLIHADYGQRVIRCGPVGAVLIWAVVVLSVLIGAMGLAVDTWYASLTVQQLQNAADAAALAGAQHVLMDQDQARVAAQAIAGANSAGGQPVNLALNGGNDPGGEIVLGFFDEGDHTFTPTLGAPNAVQVLARRTSGSTAGPLPLLWGPVFGVDSANLSRYAIGLATEIRLGALVLNANSSCALELKGTPSEFVVTHGGVQVNSSSPTAVCNSGQPTIDTSILRVVGGVSSGFPAVHFGGDLKLHVPPVTDPLAPLPEPNRPLLPGTNVMVNNKQILTLPTGYYKGITVKPGGKLLLLPGLFYIDGTFDIKGDVTGSGVMIFISPNGNFKHTSQGTLQLTPMDPVVYPLGPIVPESMLHAGVTIFQSRGNTSDASIHGGSGLSIEGLLYFRDALLDIGGNSENLAGSIIVDRLLIHGTGRLVIKGEGIPPIPGSVYLVR